MWQTIHMQVTGSVIASHVRRIFVLMWAWVLCTAALAQTPGEVYLVLGSDTAIWEGMDTSRYHCHYQLGLYTNQTRNAYKVMAPEFRNQFLDSYGQTLKLTWWMMAGQIFRYADNTDVPVPNTMTLHLMKKYHGQAIQQFGDELTLHYHTFAWTNYAGGTPSWTQANSFRECKDDFDFTIAQFLLEEGVYPISFRSGWEWMETDWQNYLNEVLPFSLEANWHNVWGPYHPSTSNYRSPGDGKGWNARCIYMANISQTQMNAMFAKAAAGTDQLACVWAHLPEADFLTNIANVNAKAQLAAQAYPSVKFRYCTAVEGMQRWLKTYSDQPPQLELVEEPRTDKLAFTLRTDKPIFQARPFVAYKDIYRQTRIADCTETGSNAWRVVLPLPKAGIADVRVAVTDSSGHLATNFLSLAAIPEPPDPLPSYSVIVDNPHAVLSGAWTLASSSADRYGADYRYKTQGDGSASVRFTAVPTNTANYQVFEWHPQGANRSTNVAHVIRHAGGEQTVYVNQQVNGGRWNLLGTFPFSAGTEGSVTITDAFPDAGKVVLADAIKFEVPAIAKPSILSPPLDRTAEYGEPVEFCVFPAGSEPLAVQWQFNGENIPGATSMSYIVPAADYSRIGKYSVIVSNSAGTADAEASLVVNPPVAPEIGTHPQSIRVDPGASATFSVAATGTRPLSYQWFLNSVPIPQGTNQGLVIETARASDTGEYRVEVSNIAGTAVSSNAMLRLYPPVLPTITSQPESHSVAAGNRFALSVGVAGSPPFTYQWRKATVPVQNSDSPRLVLSPVQPSDAGDYDVVVSNPAGSVTSEVAVVSVYVLPFPKVTSMETMPGGLQIGLSNSPGSQFLVEVSTNLHDWLPLTTSPFGTNTFSFADAESTGLERRFYLSRGMPATLLADFEAQATGAPVMFQNPAYSGTTKDNINSALPSSTAVTQTFPAGHAGAKVLQVMWSFNPGTSRWLRLTSSGGPVLPNPTIDFREGVQFDVYADNAVYICLGLRETSPTGEIGTDGGSSGAIEWVGGRTLASTSPPAGILVPGGQWTTLRFFLPYEPVKLMTGDNRLDSTTGKGVLEHLAILPADPQITSYNLYLDNFEVIYIRP